MNGWQFLVDALGIIYFTAWSVSFYPQALLNYRRKSTSGLSTSFSLLNPLGFLSYTTYTLTLSFNTRIRSQYAARHDGHTPEVEPSDIAFAIHALVLSLVNLGQVIWYHRRNRKEGGETQRLLEDGPPKSAVEKNDGVASWTWISIGIMVLGTALGGLLVKQNKLVELDLMYWISYIKLYISVAKYIPQLWMNFRRKTTLGFSIHVILLDLTGSMTSLLQLIIASIFISHDPSGIIANPVKLGLSLITLMMDGIFVWQRYGLYGQPVEIVVEEVER